MKKTIIIAALALISCVVLSGCASQASESRASRFKPYSDKVVITLPDGEEVEGRIMPWEPSTDKNIPNKNRIFAIVGVCAVYFLVALTMTLRSNKVDTINDSDKDNINRNASQFVPCFLQISDVKIPLDAALERLGMTEREAVALLFAKFKDECGKGCKCEHTNGFCEHTVGENVVCDEK